MEFLTVGRNLTIPVNFDYSNRLNPPNGSKKRREMTSASEICFRSKYKNTTNTTRHATERKQPKKPSDRRTMKRMNR